MGQQEEYVYNPMQHPYFQNPMQFGHDPPQPYAQYQDQAQQEAPYGHPFNNFTPPGHDPSQMFQNTFPMPFNNQMSMQPQDEKPMHE